MTAAAIARALVSGILVLGVWRLAADALRAPLDRTDAARAELERRLQAYREAHPDTDADEQEVR